MESQRDAEARGYLDAMNVRIRFLSRRMLVLDAAAFAGLAACDRLVLPEGAPAAPGEELDPITPNADFYVTSCCGTPEIDRDSWSMAIQVGGETRATIDLAWLEARDAREREHTLQCIGSSPAYPLISNAVWEGLPLTEILDALGVEVPESAVEIVITGADGYSTSIPVGDLASPVWLVWRMNGERLPEEHGTTVRMLTPGRYGTKNPKWITAIDLVDEPHLGYWETFGWSNDATYNTNGMVLTPIDATTFPPGAVRVLGTAFAGRDPIARVEVRVDDGEWRDATITYPGGPDVWTLWAYDWDAPAGDHTVRVRVTTASGATDSGDPDGTDRLEGYDGGMEIRVTVA